jgi:hypothetical protein
MRKDLYANYPLPRPSARSALQLSACARRLSRHQRTFGSEELKKCPRMSGYGSAVPENEKSSRTLSSD